MQIEQDVIIFLVLLFDLLQRRVLKKRYRKKVGEWMRSATRTTNRAKYHDIKQDVLLRIEAIIREQGAEIAFPTSTIHLAQEPA